VNRILGLLIGLPVFLFALLAVAPGVAGEIRVAVAANFIEPVKEIGALFEKQTGHRAVFSSGGTGQLYAQITQDAPFEVFLAADQATAQKAIDGGFAVPGSRFTYATGRLALFGKDRALVNGQATLREGRFQKLAIANPATAPYGAAAVQAMKALGVYDALTPKLVQGNNIAQTHQFVETGNAELGFVALSQIVRHAEGSRWLVPESLHAPIAQDAVLLKRGVDSEAARAFLALLKGPEGRVVVQKFGYGAGG
jgi:molybdate transport system substrate-binding protein